MINTINIRFDNNILPLLKCLNCLSTINNNNLSEVEQLCQFYKNDLDAEAAKLEYTLLCSFMDLQSENKSTGIHKMYLNIVKNNLTSVYPNISLLYRLILTLPSTSASCERSFSALKFVKNSLRTTMSQPRLRDLMILAVEGERSKTLDLCDVREKFWSSTRK